ncbi:MAG: hypothetical protein H7066_02785 [Cytophagaceae bacterium]|nr:hypothetical protein [Gemmatimonadaceae bacterium]
MIRHVLVVTAFCAATGCSSSASEPKVVDETPATPSVTPDAFAGVWRSTTPSLEFVGLSVYSKSSEQGVLAARLTFSGVAWEGAGRIDGDSLVASMTPSAGTTPASVIVARALDARTLQVRMRWTAGTATDLRLTFVRND